MLCQAFSSCPHARVVLIAEASMGTQDQYMEISTSVPETAALYGLGERTSSTGIELRRDGIPLALWNRDHQAALPDQNVYGSHPILMDVREGAASLLCMFFFSCLHYRVLEMILS